MRVGNGGSSAWRLPGRREEVEALKGGRFAAKAAQALLERSLIDEPIRTRDAVHLATAELLGEPPPLMTIVTRDDRVRENAVALGYAVA